MVEAAAAYYNEIDPYCVQWLRNLIEKGLIAPGDVDDRSIVDVQPNDLKGYTQCHFFTGLGGWSYALRLAGWPDDRPVWTGSCPCQPFSAAGKQKGTKDERHLWPEFRRLIAECSPSTVFGEQVASRLGREWLATVRLQMEALGYAVGAADLCAAGAGAPHIRQRLWFVANTERDPANAGRSAIEPREGIAAPAAGASTELGRCSVLGIVDNPASPRQQSEGKGPEGEARDEARLRVSSHGCWQDLEWLQCTDGKQRPTQPGLFPLAHGIPARVAKLRAAGNAIVPQVAAEFIKAAM